MNKKEPLPASDQPSSGNNLNHSVHSPITNTFNPSIQVNPTIHVTTETPVNVKNELPGEARGSRATGRNTVKRIVIAIIIGLTVSVAGYFLKKSLSKGDPTQEEINVSPENAVKTN
ncbi:MAG: hypothetical protein MUC87_01285 [Bacteroidia bacterium]|jgi:hypothetical protein|nr:hypothetical protein [Bacteroidia bacterium]